jgi:hypothetical protein
MNKSYFSGAPIRFCLTSGSLAVVLAGLSLAFAGAGTPVGHVPPAGHSHAGHPKPLAAWAFAQTDGNFVPDASGHGYDALIYGSPQLTPRWHGDIALTFDGSGDNSFWRGGEQNCGLGVTKRLNQAFTELSIAAWVRKQPAWWMPVVYRDMWDAPSGFGLYMEWSSGKAYFGHYDAIGHGSAVQSETVVQDGEWHYVVGTLQPASGGGYLYRIYVDGRLDAEHVGSWAVEQAPAEGGLLKIAYPNGSGADNPFKGDLDKIAIFDVALTPVQVKARFETDRERVRPDIGREPRSSRRK